MSDLFLIAHKVRSEPAFDIASRMACPECIGEGCGEGCAECDGFGYWWIIPTSGHRAYPWWHGELTRGFSVEDILVELPMPLALTDHYPPKATPATPRIDILSLLPTAPKGPTIRRRL